MIKYYNIEIIEKVEEVIMEVIDESDEEIFVAPVKKNIKIVKKKQDVVYLDF